MSVKLVTYIIKFLFVINLILCRKDSSSQRSEKYRQRHKVFKMNLNTVIDNNHRPGIIYALQLEDGYFYVGKTIRDVNIRINEHKNGDHTSSTWTRLHSPIRRLKPITYIPNDLESWERAETLERMWRYGIQRVRGWQYTMVNISTMEQDNIIAQLCERKDLCRYCGYGNHSISNCKAMQTNNVRSKADWMRDIKKAHYIHPFYRNNPEYIEIEIQSSHRSTINSITSSYSTISNVNASISNNEKSNRWNNLALRDYVTFDNIRYLITNMARNHCCLFNLFFTSCITLLYYDNYLFLNRYGYSFHSDGIVGNVYGRIQHFITTSIAITRPIISLQPINALFSSIFEVHFISNSNLSKIQKLIGFIDYTLRQLRQSVLNIFLPNNPFQLHTNPNDNPSHTSTIMIPRINSTTGIEIQSYNKHIKNIQPSLLVTEIYLKGFVLLSLLSMIIIPSTVVSTGCISSLAAANRGIQIFASKILAIYRLLCLAIVRYFSIILLLGIQKPSMVLKNMNPIITSPITTTSPDIATKMNSAAVYNTYPMSSTTTPTTTATTIKSNNLPTYTKISVYGQIGCVLGIIISHIIK